MKRMTLICFCAVAALLLAAGCASPRKVTVVSGCEYREVSEHTADVHFGEIRGVGCVTSHDDLKKLGDTNRDILTKKYAGERNYLGGKRPQLGLALSGGGTRSASFNVGVMKALQKNGILERVDVISSVSNGSYASYWYFMQNYYLNRGNLKKEINDKLSDDLNADAYMHSQAEFEKKGAPLLFAGMDYCLTNKKPGETLNNLSDPNGYRFQYVLQESSNILTMNKKPGLWRDIKNGAQYTVNLGTQVLSVPLHWLFNGAVNWNANLNPYRHYYENGLERTYGYVPLSYNLEDFANDQNAWIFFRRVNAKNVFFKDMREYLEEYKEVNGKKLPYFIINATADYSSAIRQSKRKRLLKAVYEFTPWSCGSGLTGHVSAESCPSNISFGRAVSISGAAVDGQNEAIDAAGRSEGKIYTAAELTNVLNLDLGFNILNHDPDASRTGSYLYKIIPFPLYFLADLTVGKKVNDIHLSDGGHVENLGIFSLVRRGVKTIIAVDAELDGSSSFTSLKRLKQNLKREMGLDLTWDAVKAGGGETDRGAVNVHYTPSAQAIIQGKITGFVNEDGAAEELKLVYIKLSVQSDQLQTTGDPCKDAYPYSVVQYAKKHDNFPHEPTSDIFYSADQFRAYRDLGFAIADKLEKSDLDPKTR